MAPQLLILNIWITRYYLPQPPLSMKRKPHACSVTKAVAH